tara:strand:+ start:36723 stop:37901 length:1179 start_codon:yes stop_codon:yes gene_type:complete
MLPRILQFKCIFTACLVAATGCATRTDFQENPVQDGPVCSYADVVFSGDFESGRLSACEQTGTDQFTLYFGPEDTPINPSSWYAFSIDSGAQAELELKLEYIHGKHRYTPKISRDAGRTWAVLGDDPGSKGDVTTLRVGVSKGRTLIAAQPLFGLDHYRAWLQGAAMKQDIAYQQIGVSEAGRDIEALTFGAEGAPVLVLMGRQHPPEITGALALEAFVDRLLESDPLAVRFRTGFRVAVAPVLNPDGVALGQWRHNTRGVDLNRDWGPFTQSETRAARDWLAGLGELAVAMDFHSTWKDTLYTQPDDADGSRPEFSGALSDRLVQSLGAGAPHRDASHNPDLATSKTWIHETYKIPALTYEVGDSTHGDEIIRIARLAAEETMALLLGENE